MNCKIIIITIIIFRTNIIFQTGSEYAIISRYCKCESHLWDPYQLENQGSANPNLLISRCLILQSPFPLKSMGVLQRARQCGHLSVENKATSNQRMGSADHCLPDRCECQRRVHTFMAYHVEHHLLMVSRSVHKQADLVLAITMLRSSNPKNPNNFLCIGTHDNKL